MDRYEKTATLGRAITGQMVNRAIDGGPMDPAHDVQPAPGSLQSIGEGMGELLSRAEGLQQRLYYIREQLQGPWPTPAPTDAAKHKQESPAGAVWRLETMIQRLRAQLMAMDDHIDALARL